MKFREYWKSFRRSWVHETGTQMATLSVLAATFTVVAFVFCLSMNLNRLLTQWGESVQMTVYVQDKITDQARETLKAELEGDSRFKSVEFIPKESATQLFRTQMATYAPELLADEEFLNPFPASFQVKLKNGIPSEQIASVLEGAAKRLSSFSGVEEVSYGQSWVSNYSGFVRALSASGWVIAAILVAGSFFVVGNSIRASISARRDEIEILELVGATKAMIRAPFLFEGALMGTLAAVIAVSANFALFAWQISVLKSNLALARIAASVDFIGVLGVLGVIATGMLVGTLGAFLTVRALNDGWSASQRSDA